MAAHRKAGGMDGEPGQLLAELKKERDEQKRRADAAEASLAAVEEESETLAALGDMKGHAKKLEFALDTLVAVAERSDVVECAVNCVPAADRCEEIACELWGACRLPFLFRAAKAGSDALAEYRKAVRGG